MNPWTHQIIGETKELSESALLKIIEESKKALDDIKSMTKYQFGNICHRIIANLIKNKENLLKIVIEETGLVKRDALCEIERAIQSFEIASEMYPINTNEKIHISCKEFIIVNNVPGGIVLAITPSTSPLSSPAHKISSSLLSKCVVLLKPSPFAILSAYHLVLLLWNSGIPRHFLKFVPLFSPKKLRCLVQNDKIRIISFTGKYKNAINIIKLAKLKKFIMELSGNCSCIILPHCKSKLLSILDQIINSIITKNGQRCISLKNLFVEETILKYILERLPSALSQIKVGNPMEEDILIGPLINERAARFTCKKINEFIKQGAKPLLPLRSSRNIIYPIALFYGSYANRIVRKALNTELEGPVVNIISFKKNELNAVIELINGGHYGLQTSIFAQNISYALTIANKIQSGSIIINGMPIYRSPFLPFGGFRRSGLEREGYPYLANSFMEAKTIYVGLQ